MPFSQPPPAPEDGPNREATGKVHEVLQPRFFWCSSLWKRQTHKHRHEDKHYASQKQNSWSLPNSSTLEDVQMFIWQGWLLARRLDTYIRVDSERDTWSYEHLTPICSHSYKFCPPKFSQVWNRGIQCFRENKKENSTDTPLLNTAQQGDMIPVTSVQQCLLPL